MIPYTELCALSEKYGTDKRPEGVNGGPGGHGYTHYYHELLSSRRLTARTVIEIGIDVGASLRMWEEYFPNAIIHGLDCDTNKLITEGRIRSHFCEQGSVESLREAVRWIGSPIDFLIDDGSHRSDHQIVSANTLLPSLAPDGIYVIEDVLDPNEIIPFIPYPCEVVPFLVSRDPYSKLVVIRRPR